MTPVLLAAAGPSPLWYLTRGTGIVALLLLTATVVLGIGASARWTGRRWPRFLSTELHRRLSLIVVVLLAVHIVTAELDTYAPVGWAAVLVPFVSRYRPLWLGLGTLAFDLLLAVGLTSVARFRIGPRLWRAVHWSAYLCWPAAVVHGLGTGSDAGLGLVQALTVGCVLAVAGAVAARVLGDRALRPAVRAVVLGAVAVTLVGIGAWARQGPLRPGWSKRAGTPAALLGATASSGGSVPPAASTAPAGSSPGSAALLPFTEPFAGALSQRQEDGGDLTITIDGTLSGSRPGHLRLELRGQAAGGGISLRSSAVTLVVGGDTLTGTVVALDGDALAASVAGGGVRAALSVALHITPASGAVTGTVTATTAG